MASLLQNIFKLTLFTFTFVLLCSCADSARVRPLSAHSGNYTMADFSRVNKIDAHVHANNSSTTFVEEAIRNNFHLLSINVDYPDFPDIEVQKKITLQLSKAYPQIVHFAATFSMQNWGSKNWSSEVIKQLDKSRAEGAVAVKVWKNIGMEFRDQDHQLLMINDPGFDAIFAHLAEQKIPLIGHQGEPYNCWLPVEKMSVKNDQEYFTEHPQYHMYLHPEMPGYEQQMAVRDAMLVKNPDLQFMGAHLASLEWSIDALQAFLNHFPNAVVDMAARMGQLQAQSQQDRHKVRQFFLDFQDRILYATDLTHPPGSDDAAFRAEVQDKWLADWRYLNTDSVMQVSDLDGTIIGLALPKTVIDKIYRLNAEHFFKLN